MSYSYHAYGLNCISNARISAFSSASGTDNALQIVLTRGTQPPTWVQAARKLEPSVREMDSGAPQNSTHSITAFGTDEFFELAYADGTRFIIDRGAKRLWAACQPPLTLDHLAIYLQGPVMGFALRQRGVTALHASAVCIGGQAVILCGPREAGKSTTAAALAMRGAPVLCDDIAAITEKDNEFHAESGCARVCLWPDAVEELFGSPKALPRLVPDWEKCFLPLDGRKARFEADKRSVSAIYLFAPREGQSNAPRIEDLTIGEALVELVKNTYMNWLLDRQQRAAEFSFLSKLVTQVPVRRIVPHLDPAGIGKLCEMIAREQECLITRPATSFLDAS